MSSVRRAALVDLVLGDGTRLAARVSATEAGAAVLTRLGHGGPVGALRRPLPALLEYGDVSGPRRWHGRVEATSWREARFVPGGDAPPLTDAAAPPAAGPQCVLRRADGSTSAGRVVALGCGGMLVAAPSPLTADEVVGFALEALPDGPPIAGRARVFGAPIEGAHPLEFTLLPADDGRRLRALAAAA